MLSVKLSTDATLLSWIGQQPGIKSRANIGKAISLKEKYGHMDVYKLYGKEGLLEFLEVKSIGGWN